MRQNLDASFERVRPLGSDRWVLSTWEHQVVLFVQVELVLGHVSLESIRDTQQIIGCVQPIKITYRSGVCLPDLILAQDPHA